MVLRYYVKSLRYRLLLPQCRPGSFPPGGFTSLAMQNVTDCYYGTGDVLCTDTAMTRAADGEFPSDRLPTILCGTSTGTAVFAH